MMRSRMSVKFASEHRYWRAMRCMRRTHQGLQEHDAKWLCVTRCEVTCLRLRMISMLNWQVELASMLIWSLLIGLSQVPTSFFVQRSMLPVFYMILIFSTPSMKIFDANIEIFDPIFPNGLSLRGAKSSCLQ
mmetsp:Transcript_8199/g.14312  ORF Transcript_8199/g.14312 Transcript_8199/m.14312 type:complete len:132 (+) Transcript_8199:1751-2146(+)